MEDNTADVSIVASVDHEHTVYLTETDMRDAWDYCNNDFGRFLQMLRFLASIGGPQE
jgi:hypothetical protein